MRQLVDAIPFWAVGQRPPDPLEKLTGARKFTAMNTAYGQEVKVIVRRRLLGGSEAVIQVFSYSKDPTAASRARDLLVAAASDAIARFGARKKFDRTGADGTIKASTRASSEIELPDWLLEITNEKSKTTTETLGLSDPTGMTREPPPGTWKDQVSNRRAGGRGHPGMGWLAGVGEAY